MVCTEGKVVMTYLKLTGKRRNWMQFSQLFLGYDHLMLLKSSRISETYSRYLLKDIQAIVVTELEPEPLRQILFGMVALLAFVAAVLVPDSWWLKGLFGVPAALALALVVVDVLRGRRCRCMLRTAVSEHVLHPLTRVGQANQVLAILLPAIASAQGPLSEVPESMVVDHQLSGPPTETQTPVPLNLYLLLGVLALNILASLVALRYDNTQLASVGIYVFAAEWIFAFFVYRNRPRFGLASSFYNLWLPGIFLMLTIEGVLLLGYFGYLVSQLARPASIRALNESMHAWPYFIEATGFSIVWRMIACVGTFIHLRSEE